MIRLWIRLATCGYSQQTMRRLIGKILWAVRPGRAASPFLAGCYAWLSWGPAKSRFTPPKVLRGLMEGIAVAMHPWTAKNTSPKGDTWFVDAAKQFHSYYIGIWCPPTGPKIVLCPKWVETQQAAELFGIECALRQAANQGRKFVTIVTDNVAAAFSAIKNKASTSLLAQNRILRRMQHILRWSGMHASIEWISSELNPADPPSRWAEFGSAEEMCVKALVIQDELDVTSTLGPSFLGTMSFRGG